MRSRSRSNGSKSWYWAPGTGCAEKSSRESALSLELISWGYIGTFSGVPSAFSRRRWIFPAEEATMLRLLGTWITSAGRSSWRYSIRTEMGGTVRLAIKAESCVASWCCSCSPVTVPSSSTPRYKSPPWVFANATIASIKSESDSFLISLLNSISIVSCSGIIRSILSPLCTILAQWCKYVNKISHACKFT